MFYISTQKVKKLHNAVKNLILYKRTQKGNELWQVIHHSLLRFKKGDFKQLAKEIVNWSEEEQHKLFYIISEGTRGWYKTKYSEVQKRRIVYFYTRLLGKIEYQEIESWLNTYNFTKNTDRSYLKVQKVYNRILSDLFTDSEYWSAGGGNDDIQTLLNEFTESDWKLLKKVFKDWSHDEITILIEAIGYDSDIHSGYLDYRQIDDAGRFLLDIFLEGFEYGYDFLESCAFIIIFRSNKVNIDELKVLKNWFIKNNYDKYNPCVSYNPVELVDQAIKRREQL